MDDLITRIQSLLASGAVVEAEQLLQAEAARQPVLATVGRAALAAHRSDAAACFAEATAAHALDPREPAASEYLAVAHLMRGDTPTAERYARAAVDLGGGRRSLGGLANILLGSGRPGEAEEVYRQILDAFPADLQALNGVATARFRQGDADGASTFFARAFDENPLDPAPIHSLMNMYAEAGRLLGAIAFANLMKDRSPGDELQVLLDVLLLQLTKLLLHQFPGPNIIGDADDTVRHLMATAKKRPPRVRLGVARALIDIKRSEEAQHIADELDTTPLGESDRANLLYVKGLLATEKGDKAAALLAFTQSVEIDPRRWDACANAISLLLDEGGDDALTGIGALLLRVPLDVKRTAPQLLLNEAIYLRRLGQNDGARHNLEMVIAGLRGHGELAALAKQILGEMTHD